MADPKKSTYTDLLVQALKELAEKTGIYNPATAQPNLPGVPGLGQRALQNRGGQLDAAIAQQEGAPPATLQQ